MSPAVPSSAAVASQAKLFAQLRDDPDFVDFLPWSEIHRPDRLLDAGWTAGCRSPIAYRQNADGSLARSHRQVAVCLDPQEQLVVIETWVAASSTFARLHEYGENVERAVTRAEAGRAEMRRSHPAFKNEHRDERFAFDAPTLRLALNERRARRIVPVVLDVRQDPALLANLMVAGLRPDELRAVRALMPGTGETRSEFLARIKGDVIAALAEAMILEHDVAELRRGAGDIAARPSPGENIDNNAT